MRGGARERAGAVADQALVGRCQIAVGVAIHVENVVAGGVSFRLVEHNPDALRRRRRKDTLDNGALSKFPIAEEGFAGDRAGSGGLRHELLQGMRQVAKP
jgi:hypothetical protein